MNALLAIALTGLVAQEMPVSPGIHDLTLSSAGRVAMTYAVSIPKGYSPGRPVPLVLVLHSGGQRFPHYGREFMKMLVQPALNDWGAIMIAPDCPTESWTDDAAEQAVVALVQQAQQAYPIDRRRVLVTGFSLGGRGTWFLASRHADLFTAAIPMAASTGGAALSQLGTIPTYIIHSRDDQVVAFGPEERTAKELTALGRPVRFEALWGLTHYEMFRYVEALRKGGRWVMERWNEAR
jgi:predicted peptidase